MATVTFLSAGTDETGDLSLFPLGWDSTSLGNEGTDANGSTCDTATDQAHTGTRSLKSVAAVKGTSSPYAVSPNSVVADAGAAHSCWVRFSTATPSVATVFLVVEDASDGSTVFGLAISTSGKLVIGTNAPSGFILTPGTTTLAANTWTRVSISYTITNTTTFTIKAYLNGVLELTGTNATIGPLHIAGSSCVVWGLNSLGTNFATSPKAMTVWYDDLYIDNRSDLTDPGAIQVTAKRPSANGTTNGFTTQIGAGGSGYGTGHSPQVNERPLGPTNGWSLALTTKTTEDYTVEGVAVGDVDLTGAPIVGVRGWIDANASAADSPVSHIIVDGTATAFTATTTAAIYTQNSATPTVYPAGTGTDIGMDGQYTTTAHLWSLFECGILVAYTPAPAGGPFVTTTTDLPPSLLTKPYARDLRTTIDPLKLDLRGLDRQFGAPGEPQTYDYPNPVPKTYPRDLRTTVDPLKIDLLGQDRQFGAIGEPQTYDYPNPTPKLYPLDLRTFLQRTAAALLSQTVQFGAPGQPQTYDYPNPAAKTYPRDLRTWLEDLALNLLGQDTLFGKAGETHPYDWPNPVAARYPLDLRTFLNPIELQLLGLDQFFGKPGEVPRYDWPNPVARNYPLDLRTAAVGLNTTTLPPPGTQPFTQTDWPLPTRMNPYPLDLRTGTSWFTIDDNLPGPPYQTDWPLPTPRTYPSDLRTWLQNLAELPLLQPFQQAEWPVPAGKPYALDLRTFLGRVILSGVPQPFTQTGWPLGTPKGYPLDLRTFLNGIELALLGQDQQFGAAGQSQTYDYPNPVPKAYPLSLRSTLGPGPWALVPPVPTYDYPNPVWKGYPLSLRTATGPGPWALVQPPPCFDYPNPVWKGYPLSLRSTLAALPMPLIGQDTLFGAPGQVPAYDWPNPVARTYPPDLRTSTAKFPVALAPTANKLLRRTLNLRAGHRTKDRT